MKILSGDGDTTLDAYVLPDGDTVLMIDDKRFRICLGSQPFEQTDIYVQAAKLVYEIMKYKKNEQRTGKNEEDVLS